MNNPHNPSNRLMIMPPVTATDPNTGEQGYVIVPGPEPMGEIREATFNFLQTIDPDTFTHLIGPMYPDPVMLNN